MKIKALAPWFGGKRTLAPEIVRQIGVHRAYWEPFCGSCAVLFAKERCPWETVNDLHGDLINLAMCLQVESKALDLYARVSRTLFHEDMLPFAKGVLSNEITIDVPVDPQGDVHRAYWYLVFSWMGLNGISGTPMYHTGTVAARYSTSGASGSQRWQSVAESIPDWHRRLQGVTILRRDAFTIIPRIADEPGTVIYCDPPYIEKGASYVHDFTALEHQHLATLLQRFELARVVVSYYDHPALADLYRGWTKVDVARAKHLVNSGQRIKGEPVTAPEVLLINGPSYEAPTLFGDQP